MTGQGQRCVIFYKSLTSAIKKGVSEVLNQVGKDEYLGLGFTYQNIKAL